MNKPSSILKKGLVAFAAVLAVTAAVGAAAAPGGGGGGGHAAGGGGGFHGGGGAYHGGGGYRGGGYGGYRGGYGGRGYYGGRYYGGYRGYGGWGYGWRGWGWGWGWGLGGVGLGWYLATLPYGYSTYWWGGVPYYYANNSYYLWDSGVGQYEAVEPPEGLTTTPSPSTGSTPPAASGPAGTWTDLFAYPKGGQSTEQQTKDREECHQWAVSQTGFDPSQPPLSDPRAAAGKREGYLRAEAACLEGRNYSVK